MTTTTTRKHRFMHNALPTPQAQLHFMVTVIGAIYMAATVIIGRTPPPEPTWSVVLHLIALEITFLGALFYTIDINTSKCIYC